MPYSSNVFDQKIKQFIVNNSINLVLDVGAGAGKYSDILKEVKPDLHINAIEPDISYFDQFSLGNKYDIVYQCKVQDYREQQNYDLIIFGDVLEHLPKSEGIDAVNRLVYKTKYLIAVFPYAYIQGKWEGHELEEHISVWSDKDFDNFQTQYFREGFMKMILMKGFLQ